MSIALKILCFLLVSTACFGQNPNIKRTNHWYFGNGAGLDFSNGIAVIDISSTALFSEACSVISDTSGNLIFYTDGEYVWDRNHRLMPNGFGMFGCNSSTQGALIVPIPGNSMMYYIFTNSWGCIDSIGDLRFSVVDLSLNGGFGDIVSKNNFLFAPVTEQINATLHKNEQDIWLTTHELYTNKFITYLITDIGIDTFPVISAIGSIYPSLFPNCVVTGELKFSPNGRKLAVAGSTCDESFNISELFDFDNETGLISNFLSLPTDSFDYALSFSQDNSKLYFGGGWPISHIVQYDLDNSTDSLIIDSKSLIFSSLNDIITGLQLAPDNKIYVARFNTDTLGIIQDPNNQGTNCNYINNGFFLNGLICYESLPDFPEFYFRTNTLSILPFIKQKKINVNPNPFKDFTLIEFENSNRETYEFNLFTSEGIPVKTIVLNSNQITLEREFLNSGIYIFNIKKEGIIFYIGKIIVID